MAAGMHHRDGFPCLVGGPDRAAEGETGLFCNRQGVHVGTKQDGGPVTIPERRNQTITAHPGYYLVTQCPELFCQVG